MRSPTYTCLCGVSSGRSEPQGYRVDGSSIDMYNNDVGQESAQKFMK